MEHKTHNNTVIIKELNIEVESTIHSKGEKIQNIKIPDGWRLLKFNEIIFLHNNDEYRKQLNLDNTWEYIEQPLEFNKLKEQAVAFYSSPYGANFYCNRNPNDAIPSLGVRFCRNLREKY